MNKTKLGAILACLTALAACSTVEPAPASVLHCPTVPPCLWPQATIVTNADLVHELVNGRAAFATCRIARDTLQTCIESQHDQSH